MIISRYRFCYGLLKRNSSVRHFTVLTTNNGFGLATNTLKHLMDQIEERILQIELKNKAFAASR